MARPPRNVEPGSWHHVMTRGADRQDVFVDDVDRSFLESMIAEAVERSAIEVHAHALMTNHLHLLAHCPDGDLSGPIQHVLGRYASFFNDRHQRSGPLFGGRFRSVAVETDEQLAVVGRYIHRNPLDLTGLASLAAYRWSSAVASSGSSRGKLPLGSPSALSSDPPRRRSRATDASSSLRSRATRHLMRA